jgi:hypothetical protein
MLLIDWSVNQSTATDNMPAGNGPARRNPQPAKT